MMSHPPRGFALSLAIAMAFGSAAFAANVPAGVQLAAKQELVRNNGSEPETLDPALASGGMRWLHVDGNGVVFVRESAAECVLVVASRGAMTAEFPAELLPGASSATLLYGSARIDTGGSVHVSTEGTAFAAWALPGVDAPAPAG